MIRPRKQKQYTLLETYYTSTGKSLKKSHCFVFTIFTGFSERQKTGRTYFKIQGTYFKLCALYFFFSQTQL